MLREKIQKVLAQRGFASRREIERWIEAGRITVNGKKAEIGMRVSDKDRICVDDRSIVTHDENSKTRVLLYHKPANEICTRSDPEGRRTVYQSLPKIRRSRWIGVGRLDFATTGLLLFTNSGELAHRLMHPSQQIEQEYLVRVRGEITPDMMKRMLVETITPDHSEGINHWYTIVVKEGKNRVIRRVIESQGLMISRLKRIRFGSIVLEKHLPQGQWLELTDKSLQRLFAMVDLQFTFEKP